MPEAEFMTSFNGKYLSLALAPIRLTTVIYGREGSTGVNTAQISYNDISTG